MEQLRIEQMKPGDWPSVARIYAQGIATGNATFRTTVPAREDWDREHLSVCRFVAVAGESIAGWAALSPVSGRCVYAGVAEVSVYIDPAFAGQGIGTRLLTALIKESEQEGLWTLQAGIFPENSASISLHEKCGFRAVGLREKLGKMDGRWRDVLLLERRSRISGV